MKEKVIIPLSLYMPKISYTNKIIDVITYEFPLHWSTKKGSYKDSIGKNHNISLEDALFFNNFSKLANTIVKLANIFSNPGQYILFWQTRLNIINNFSRYYFERTNFTSPNFVWFLSKIGSASSVFLNEIGILLETIFVFSDANLFNNSGLKNTLLINSYSLIEAFVISINTVYVSINKSGKELIKFDQRLNKINKFEDFEKKDFLEKEVSDNFKKYYKKISEIRNIIVHPFSYKHRENKINNYSYWQINYVDNKLNANEIELIKMNETKIEKDTWIKDIMKLDPFEKKKYNILNLLNDLLNEILNYFKKNKEEMFQQLSL